MLVIRLSPRILHGQEGFQRARADLLDASPVETVNDIAWRWGFRNMGRFSVEYRRLFGERPSETMHGRRIGGGAGPLQPP